MLAGVDASQSRVSTISVGATPASNRSVLVGYVVGRRTRRLADGRYFRTAVLVVCTLSALVLLIRSVA